uniref:Ribosomal protein-like n=1 Tax=Tanacetum cinerariifolium TaxID=118510 RepID=A0A699ICN1_TANCI|nr:ribosomal protein-like [Tanacetum cinerariifolium]
MHGDCQRFNTIYKHLRRKSGENDADLVENAKTSYTERYGNKRFQYDHAWNILKNYPKWNAAEPIDEDNLNELFGPDPRAHPADKQRVAKKQKSVDTRASGGVYRSLYRRLYLRIIDANVKLPKPRMGRRELKNQGCWSVESWSCHD